MANKKTETEIEEGVTVGYEMKPLEASSTPEYTLWAVEKVYFNVHFRVGADDHTSGFNFVPTYGHEVRVVLPNGTSDNIEEIPEGAIHELDFKRQFVRLADTVMAYRASVISSTNNPSQGF